MKTQIRHFTLIEMLVVITIICILCGLLMPALQRALATARQASCVNNQRQIGMAFQQYADDWHGVLPPINISKMDKWYWDHAIEKTFPHFLGEYAGYSDFYEQKYGTGAVLKAFKTSIFYCPDNPLPSERLNMFRGGYGMNPRMPKIYMNTKYLPGSAFGYCTRKVSIPQPHITVMLGERYSNNTVAQAKLTDLGTNTGYVDLIRHQECFSNFVFVDGHAASYEAMRIVTDFNRSLREQN